MPKDWDNLEDILEKFTKSNTGEDMVIGNNNLLESGERILGFSSNQLLSVMDKSAS